MGSGRSRTGSIGTGGGYDANTEAREGYSFGAALADSEIEKIFDSSNTIIDDVLDNVEFRDNERMTIQTSYELSQQGTARRCSPTTAPFP